MGKNRLGLSYLGKIDSISQKLCHHPSQIDLGKFLVGENFGLYPKKIVNYPDLIFTDKVSQREIRKCENTFKHIAIVTDTLITQLPRLAEITYKEIMVDLKRDNSNYIIIFFQWLKFASFHKRDRLLSVSM